VRPDREEKHDCREQHHPVSDQGLRSRGSFGDRHGGAVYCPNPELQCSQEPCKGLAERAAFCDASGTPVSNILLAIGLVLIGLKFGLRERLRELGRTIDRIVNILLAVIIVTYLLQVVLMLFKS
jgi:hypothetical protein